MIVALVFAHVWGVIQLIVLGSLARTVRVRTVLMALAAGLYVCAPLAVLLQNGWIRPAAWLTDVPVYVMAGTAAYTANPFIEEIVKVLPIAALLLMPAMRRQWSLTDCVLTGAAAGSGFGLAESLFRYGAAAHRANSIDQGWMLTTNMSYPVVPSVWSTINSWLPEAGVPFDKIAASGRFPPNVHLVWSALGGLAVGLIMLRRGWRWRTLAAVLLVYVAVDHTAWNAALRSQEFIGRAAIEQLRTLLWLSPILALALAWWLDRQRQHAGKDDEVSLAAEQSASPRLVGTLRAAISRLPGSLTQVYGFVRMRRACNSEQTSPLPSRGPGDLSAALVQLRDRIDRQLGHDRSSPLLPPGWSGVLGAALRRPSVIVWLLLMVPSVMWFVIGGLPQAAALQTTMSAPVAWKAVVVLSLIAQTWLAWRVLHGLRGLPTLGRLASSDDAALFALRVACGVGAIGLGGHALMRALSGFSPNSSLLDFADQNSAYGSGSPATGLQLANGAAGVVPPTISVHDLPDQKGSVVGKGAAGAVPPRAADGKYLGEIDDPNFVGAEGAYIGEVDDPDFVDAEGTYIGEVDDPDFVDAEGTYIGEVGDPTFLADQPPSDGAPDTTLDEIAALSAEMTAREAADVAAEAAKEARAADARVAESFDAWSRAEHAMVEEAQKGLSESAKAGAYGGSTPEQDASFLEARRAMDEASKAERAALDDQVVAKRAADLAHAHAAVADADAAVARAAADSQATHMSYLADMAAARAADAAAKAADPSADPRTRFDVNAAAIAAKKALDAKIAAAEAAKAWAEGVEAAKQAEWKYYKP